MIENFSKPEVKKNPIRKVDIDKRIEPGKTQSEINTSKINFDLRVKDLYIRLPSSDYFDWAGERGNSVAIPKNEGLYNVCRGFGREGVEYRNKFPDFSPFARETVEVNRMSSSRNEVSKRAYASLAEKWNKEKKDGNNNWTARDVKQWKKENDLDCHENPNSTTIEFVPSIIHRNFPHTGGHAVEKNKEKHSNNESIKFDT